MTTRILEHAQQLWTYLSSARTAHASGDAIVVCCSYDLRVGDHGGDLWKRGVAPRLVLSGGHGNWTSTFWDEPEAHVFRERVLSRGVDPNALLIEDRAANFGDNIAYSRALLPTAKRVTFVTKPNSILRAMLTIPIQWPEVDARVDAPAIAFPDGVSNAIGIPGVIDEMVGDIHRIIEYPAKGFQVPHEIPDDVLASWEFLMAQGFRRHLLDGPVSRPVSWSANR